MEYKAKWHKSCHLKFAQSKSDHLKDKLSKKRKLECEEQRKSRRMSTGTPSKSACIFCSQDTGKLHACLTMNLDYDLWQMATELQDTELLARISGGDLVAMEAKIPF